MMTLSLALLALLHTQAAPAVAACAQLTPQEVSALIGGSPKPMTVTDSPNGSACRYQNGEKTITVMLTDKDTADSAKAQWEAKKRVSAGKDVAGWTVPAYAGTMETPKEHVAIVGIAKGKRFVETKVMDVSQTTADLSTKLLDAMKAVAGRLR